MYNTDHVVCVLLGWTLLECGMSVVQFGSSADIYLYGKMLSAFYWEVMEVDYYVK